MGMDDPLPTFATLLQRSRQAAGLTQEDLADWAEGQALPLEEAIAYAMESGQPT